MGESHDAHVSVNETKHESRTSEKEHQKFQIAESKKLIEGEWGQGEGERERSRGSSMEICSVESEMDGLKERRERLERAARLLNGEAKKEGGRRKQDDGADHGKSLGGGHS